MIVSLSCRRMSFAGGFIVSRLAQAASAHKALDGKRFPQFRGNRAAHALEPFADFARCRHAGNDRCDDGIRKGKMKRRDRKRHCEFPAQYLDRSSPIDEVLASLGRRRRVVLTVNQFFTAGRVVTQSNLLTVLPDSFITATGYQDKLVTRPLPMSLPGVHVEMLWHARHDDDPRQRWLRRELADASRCAA